VTLDENQPMTRQERERYLNNLRVKKWQMDHRDTYLQKKREYNRITREREAQRQEVIRQLEQREAALDRLTVLELIRTLVGLVK
jgi:hypothetical protein